MDMDEMMVHGDHELPGNGLEDVSTGVMDVSSA